MAAVGRIPVVVARTVEGLLTIHLQTSIINNACKVPTEVADWNDNRLRTHAELITDLDAAIAQLDQAAI
jgi:hypothetical protein